MHKGALLTAGLGSLVCNSPEPAPVKHQDTTERSNGP